MVRGTFSPARAWWLAAGPASTRTFGTTFKALTMPKALRIALSVIAGFLLGSAVNMSLLAIGGKLIPPPAGANVSTMEGLKAALPLFEARHFLFPFLAHALGTLAGVMVPAVFGSVSAKVCALIVGLLFLAGGVANVVMLPSPLWFTAVDLLFAYIPAAWLGYALGCKLRAARGGA